MTIDCHDAANIFPLDEAHIEELADDIREHGLQVPIETVDGKIIDGRRRSLACRKAGVEPQYRPVHVDDPIAYVISLNLHRRHMSAGERAMAAARARELYDQQAKERQKASGGDRKSGKSLPVNLPEPTKGDARDQVGKVFGVSGKTVDHATKVLTRAVPEVVQAVDQGRMAVSTAAILATEPEAVQRAEATRPKRNRTYQSISKSINTEESSAEPEEVGEAKRTVKGVGVIRANEAINSLTRIPKHDALRKRGFQLVTDWIRHNQ